MAQDTPTLFMEIPLYKWTYDTESRTWVRGQELSARLHEPVVSAEQASRRLAEVEARTEPLVEEVTTPDIDQVPTASGLGEGEEVVALLLGHAWNQWLATKPSRDDTLDFQRAINSALRVVAARAHQERFADFWSVATTPPPARPESD